MKYIRVLTVIVFITTTIYFGYNWYQYNKKIDNTFPGIMIESDSIKVSVKATDEELLKGVTAYDKKDGDLSAKIVIESMSKFVTKGVSKITYAVADSDNHVVRKTREVEFTDYQSPRFTLSEQLCFDVGENISITDIIGAEDVYDGNIKNKVKILTSSISTRTAGQYAATAQVTNSLGDTSKLHVQVIVKQQNTLEPDIKLTTNIVYIKKNTEFDSRTYISSVKESDGKTKIANDKVKVVSTSVDETKEGFYTVVYEVTDSQGHIGNAYLTVVVE